MRRLLTISGTLSLIFLTFVGFNRLARLVVHELKRVEVAGQTLDEFPLIVRDDSGSTVLLARDLPAYLEAHPSASFLLPAGQLGEVRDSLARQLHGVTSNASRGRDSSYAFDFCNFRVERPETGRQRITVSASDDSFWENESVYEATDDSVTPLFYTVYYRLGTDMAAGAAAFLSTALFWLAVAACFRRRAAPWHRRPTSACSGARAA